MALERPAYSSSLYRNYGGFLVLCSVVLVVLVVFVRVGGVGGVGGDGW